MMLLLIVGVKIPGVYGRVSAVVDWIKNLTSDGNFCEKPPNKAVATVTGQSQYFVYF